MKRNQHGDVKLERDSPGASDTKGVAMSAATCTGGSPNDFLNHPYFREYEMQTPYRH